MPRVVKNNKACFFYVLQSDKTWGFEKGPTYIIKINKTQSLVGYFKEWIQINKMLWLP